MFEDFIIHKKTHFEHKIQDAVISDSGVLVVKSRRKIIITHIQSCISDIQLFQYFREEMNIKYRQCYGIKQINNRCDNISSCCFGIIMDSTFWIMILSINYDQYQGKRFIQIFQLKRLSNNIEASNVQLRFMNNCTPNMIVLTQKQQQEPSFSQFIPFKKYTDKFICNQYWQLQTAKPEEEPLVSFKDIVGSNLIFTLFQHYVLAYYQLKEEHNWRNHVFFYQLGFVEKNKVNQGQEDKTYPKYVITLPLFQDQRILVHVQVIPTSSSTVIQSSFIQAYYQLPTGIQVVEVTFNDPSTVYRKYLYSSLHFVEFISSSINLTELQIKGVQNCLQNHSALIITQKGINMPNYLTLMNLPSTGSPKIANKMEISQSALSIKHTISKVWIADQQNLIQINRIHKSEIYKSWMKVLGDKGYKNVNLISKQIQQLLE